MISKGKHVQFDQKAASRNSVGTAKLPNKRLKHASNEESSLIEPVAVSQVNFNDI